MVKTCSRCGIEKEYSEFSKNSQCKGGVTARCKICLKDIYKKEWGQKASKKWRENKCKDDPLAVLKMERASMASLRKQVFDHYGCYCHCPKCPETNIAFLSLEHINQDGAEHLASVGKGGNARRRILRDIVAKGFPPDYTVLCMNCNFFSFHNVVKKGVCPHMFDEQTPDENNGYTYTPPDVWLATVKMNELSAVPS